MVKHIYLKHFKKDELVFDELETRQILIFFFPSEPQFIESMPVDDKVREFAQGLLLEAIDTSYEVGFVEALFRSVANPSQGMKKIIKKFAKKSLKHWFKHATHRDLMHPKIYDFVRSEFGRRFRSQLHILLISDASISSHSLYSTVSLIKPAGVCAVLWG